MGAKGTVRRIIVGINPDLTKKGILGAIGLFVLSTVLIVCHHLVSVPRTTAGLYLFIIAGVVLAGVWAYWNSGLLICWLLVLAPVSVPLLYTEYLIVSGTPVPIALPLTLVGARAAGFWIPSTAVLALFAFSLGVAFRWAVDQ